jgi:catechol 2,3-dioxygenase-like lactoylglutathione lyase family enzyme
MPAKLLGSFLLIVAMSARGAQGQSVPYDHVHMAASDAPKAAQWYIAHLGLQPYDRPDRIMLLSPTGRVTFSFIQSEPKPSNGSVVDHLGFSVRDVDAKVKELEAAGAKMVTPVRDVAGLFKLGFVEDPWGTRLEILQDPELLGLHHIHLRVADPDATLKWYQDIIGGERAKLKGQIDGIKYTNPNIWLLVAKGEGTEPSAGHSIDHISWRFTDLDARLAVMKSKNVKVTSEPRDTERPNETLRAGMIEDPSGVKIEIVKRTPK